MSYAESFLQTRLNSETLGVFRDLEYADDNHELLETAARFISETEGEFNKTPEIDITTKTYTIGYGQKRYGFTGSPVTASTNFLTERDAMVSLKWEIARFVLPYLRDNIPDWDNLSWEQQIALISFSQSEGEFMDNPAYYTISSLLREGASAAKISESFTLYYSYYNERTTKPNRKNRRNNEAYLFSII